MTGPGGTRRRSSPPEVVERWIERWTSATVDGGEHDPVAGAVAALIQARARTGRDREAAQALLAADALLTEAVGELASADDPDGRLSALLRTIVHETDG